MCGGRAHGAGVRARDLRSIECKLPIALLSTFSPLPVPPRHLLLRQSPALIEALSFPLLSSLFLDEVLSTVRIQESPFYPFPGSFLFACFHRYRLLTSSPKRPLPLRKAAAAKGT